MNPPLAQELEARAGVGGVHPFCPLVAPVLSPVLSKAKYTFACAHSETVIIPCDHRGWLKSCRTERCTRIPCHPTGLGGVGCVGESTPFFSLSFVVSLVDPASSPSVLSRALAPTATLRVLMMPQWLKSYRTENARSMSSNMVAELWFVVVAECVQRAGGQPAELPAEKQNRRAVWCVFASVEQRDDAEDNNQEAASAREYDDKLEGELQKIYDGVLALVDRSLNLTASTKESTVIYYKTKGGVEVQFIDEVVDMSVVSQRQVPAIQQVQKIVVDVPVMLRRQAPMIQKGLKTVEIAQVQYIGKIGDVFVVTKRHVPTVQTVQKTEEVLQVQLLDPVAGVLVMMRRREPVPQTTEEIMEISQWMPQHQIRERIFEETDVLVPPVRE